MRRRTLAAGATATARVLVTVGICAKAGCSTTQDDGEATGADSGTADAPLVPDATSGDGKAGAAGARDLGLPYSQAMVRPVEIPSPLDLSGPPPPPAVFSIFGFDSNNVWAVGANGLAARYDGGSWAATQTGTTQALSSVWGLSSEDMWAVSNEVVLLRWGAVSHAPSGPPSWSNLYSPASAEQLDGLLFGYPVPTVWGASQEEVWLGSSSGIDSLGDYSHYSIAYRVQQGMDGEPPVWAPVRVPLPAGTAPCYGFEAQTIWGAQADDVWIGGCQGKMVHVVGRPAGAILGQPTETLTLNSLTAVHGTSTSNVWAVGEGGTIRTWAPSTGRWRVMPSPTTSDFHAVRVFASGDVWVAGGDSTLLTFDGTTWRQVPLPGKPETLRAIWGNTSDDLWVGGAATLLHVTRSGGVK